MADPLELHITPKRPRTLAGESIVIDIAHVVHVELDMETVELNENRTRITVTPLANPAGAFVLSGADYRRIHGPSPLVPIGRRFHAPAGSAWTSFLDLSLYRVPLSAGRYRIEIAYRHGDTGEAVVHSNAIEIEVAPAVTLAITDRWLAAKQPRGMLASLWVAADGSDKRWLYRAANQHDPDVVEVATDLTAALSTSTPMLAHLNDIAALHFERFAVWLEGDHLGWVSLGERTLITAPSTLPHGLALDSTARLLDPPLHRKDGGLSVLVVGVDARTQQATMFLADVPPQGLALPRSRPLGTSLPEHCVPVWSADEGQVSATLYSADAPDSTGTYRVHRSDLGGGSAIELFATKDRVVALLADQWVGEGPVFALFRDAQAFRVVSWRAEDASPVAQTGPTYPFATVQPSASPTHPVSDPIDIVTSPLGLVLLFRGDGEWIVMTSEKRWSLAFTESPSASVPRLVATPSAGVFLVFARDDDGFVAKRITPASDEDHEH